jgi:predicted nucleotidyltransferase
MEVNQPLITQGQISNVVNQIINNIHPDKIILFGSYAEGTPSEDSDLDLLIIQDTTLAKPKRGREIRKYLRGMKIPLDLVVYTPREIREWQDTKSAFITQIMERGKVLYG